MTKPAPPTPNQQAPGAPPAFVQGARSFSLWPGPGNPWPLFGATFRSILVARKTLFLLLLLLVPVAITLIVQTAPGGLAAYGSEYAFVDEATGQTVAPADQTGGLLWFHDIVLNLYLPLLLPLVVAIFAGSIIREEVDNKTLPYLFTRPIYRNWLVIPKWFAVVVGVYALSWVAVTTLWFSSVSLSENPFRHIDHLFGLWWVTLLTVGATCGLFTLVATLVRRGAIITGIYLFVWEAGLSNIPLGFIKRLSIVHYERSIYYPIIERNPNVFEQLTGQMGSVASHVVLIVMAVLGLLGALYVVSNKDYNV